MAQVWERPAADGSVMPIRGIGLPVVVTTPTLSAAVGGDGTRVPITGSDRPEFTSGGHS